jgi:molecular chaperone GrpE (heat shock protein)
MPSRRNKKLPPSQRTDFVRTKDRVRKLEQDNQLLRDQLVTVQQSVVLHQERVEAGMRKLLLQVLEYCDSFEAIQRAVDEKPEQVTDQMRKWLGNLRTNYRLVCRALKEQHVELLAEPREFDPHLHTVAEAIFDPGRPDGAIVEERSKGYRWKGDLLRRPRVVVVTHDEAAKDGFTANMR